MAGLITGVFAKILKDERERLNARFAEAKRLKPNLDEHEFGQFLVQIVTPIVEAVEFFNPSRTREIVSILYDISLDLLAQGLLGPHSRYPFVMQGWNELFPKIPNQISTAPRAVIGSITNALYNLSQVDGARPQEWLETMSTVAALAADVPGFLQAGQIASWRAGLSHFRSGALDLCKKTPEPLVRIALGLPGMEKPPPLNEILSKMDADVWLHPGRAGKMSGQQNLKIVSRVGAFRGFGGLFRKPPLVGCSDGHFIVKEDNTYWLLTADVFGATFHQVDGVSETESRSSIKIERDGRVRLGGLTGQFEELSDFTSAVSIGSTLAVTTSLSFAVCLVAPVVE